MSARLPSVPASTLRQVDVVLILAVGTVIQGVLLLHELRLGHRWHADDLIFSQVGTVIIGVLSVRWISPQRIGVLLGFFVALCLLLRLVPAVGGAPLELSDYMIYVMLVAVTTSGMAWPAAALLSGAALLLLAVAGRQSGGWDVEGLAYASFLTGLMTFLSVFNLRVNQQQELMSGITELALSDELTGLANRRAVDTRLRELLASGELGWGRGAVALLDLDHFKRVNDSRGHDAGDRLLREVAQLIESRVAGHERVGGGPVGGGLVGRWGGEEFIVLFGHATRSQAVACVEDVLRAVRGAGFADAPELTSSAGLAALDEGRTPDEVIKLADERLYLAKLGGRDRLVCCEDAPEAGLGWTAQAPPDAG